MISAQEVTAAVCRRFGGRHEDVFMPSRGTKGQSLLRRRAMHVYQKMNGAGYSATGRAFGRDWSSVRQAERRFAQELEADRGERHQISLVFPRAAG